MQSLAERYAHLPEDEVRKVLDKLPEKQVKAFLADWSVKARENQYPPDAWLNPTPENHYWLWVLLGGRGIGKTRSLAETTRIMKDRTGRIILAGRTAFDTRATMVEGESGILATAPNWDRPRYNPSKRQLEWNNGCIALCLSADEPDSFRGTQSGFFAADEVASWKGLDEKGDRNPWVQLTLGNRLGDYARGLVATTPKPRRVIRELVKRADVYVSRGTSYENRANLSDAYFKNVVAQYEGTRLARQEIYGEILDEIVGALFKEEFWELRWSDAAVPDLHRTIVAVDPAVSDTENSNETGIMVGGIGGNHIETHGYLLRDASGHMPVEDWAKKAVDLYVQYKADCIVAEKNNGGDLVKRNIRAVAPFVPVKLVNASKGKHKRAEPVGLIAERRLIRHVGHFPKLEGQLCAMTSEGYAGSDEDEEESPDRADAYVWLWTELFGLDRPAETQEWVAMAEPVSISLV